MIMRVTSRSYDFHTPAFVRRVNVSFWHERETPTRNHERRVTDTGGAAWANTEYNGHMTRIIGASTFIADAASSTAKAGWAVGGGVERMIDPHVMLSLEYLHYGFAASPGRRSPAFL
jgi:opacity protein-like surface antigen